MSLSGLLDAWLSPAPDPARVAFLKAKPFAHRGLHGAGLIENSRAAFRAALDAGHGIECDVQAAWDGEAFVFHDADLDRLTGEKGPLGKRPASLLDAVRLAGSDETLPRLTELLSLVAGRAALLIEVKTGNRRVDPLCRSVRRALEGYLGPVAVMSFNPEVGRWFRTQAPRIVRGLVVTEEGGRGLKGRFSRHAALWRARPDFLAYDVRDFPSAFAAAQRARGLPVLTWTVRSAEAERTAFAHADEMIYERVAA